MTAVMSIYLIKLAVKRLGKKATFAILTLPVAVIALLVNYCF